jgi:hypothetical protein
VKRAVSVRWHRPGSWKELAKFELLESIEVNGYAVPVGFITDGGSIPFGFRDTFNPLGKGFIAFIAHDKKCQDGYPRKQANREFYRDLKDSGVNVRRAYLMYLGTEAYRIVKRIK